MFDWDDQELANIIWGEGSEADEQNVRYSEDTEKKDLPDYIDNVKRKLTEGNTNSKAAGENVSTSKSFSVGSKEKNSSGDSASRVAIDTQHDSRSFAVSKKNHDLRARETRVDIGLEISEKQHEDKELGELVGNSWANIGGFDDLDRIFSTDDVDGQTSLGGRDDLWSSSKHLISGASKSSSQALGSTSWEFDTLGNTAAHFDINSEYMVDENHSVIPGFHKEDAFPSYSRRNFGECAQQQEYAVETKGLVHKKTTLGMTAKTASDSCVAAEEAATSNKSADKENWSNSQSKPFQKTGRLTGSKRVGEMYDACPSPAAFVPQFDTPATVQNYPALVPHQEQLRRGSRSMAYQNFSNPSISNYAYGNFTHQHQSMISNSEVCTGNIISLNRPMETSSKPVKMTPREKIEKLRRRQQMRAMLAIQLQQQQLGNQVPNIDYSPSQKSSQEDQYLNMDKGDFEADEGTSTIPCYDPGSPNKRDDSSTISDVDDYSAEDTIVYQLQDIVAKLDSKVRLCIRNSLYRLAQNAMQRSYTSDTSSTTRSSMYDRAAMKEESSGHDRMAHLEADTNHIDRLVAHLLFHRPFKLSSKHADTPESSTSTKVEAEQKTGGPNSMAASFLTKGSENEYNLSPLDSKTSCPFVDSCEGDILSNLPQRETTTNPQMDQKMTERNN